MTRKFILVLMVLMSMGLMASAAPVTVDVQSVSLYQGGSHTLPYTVVRIKNTTVVNCTLLDNADGSWGRDTSVAVQSSITNGSNSFVINPTWPGDGTTALWNVKCVSNYTKTYKDATNATMTFGVYKSLYSTSDLNKMVVDALGTGLFSTLSWVDLLVLLVIAGVVVSILAGLLYKAGKLIGF